jgi:hypothetical protein
MIPLAENDSESDAEYNSVNEDGAEAAKKQIKMNPDFAEAEPLSRPRDALCQTSDSGSESGMAASSPLQRKSVQGACSFSVLVHPTQGRKCKLCARPGRRLPDLRTC